MGIFNKIVSIQKNFINRIYFTKKRQDKWNLNQKFFCLDPGVDWCTSKRRPTMICPYLLDRVHITSDHLSTIIIFISSLSKHIAIYHLFLHTFSDNHLELQLSSDALPSDTFYFHYSYANIM